MVLTWAGSGQIVIASAVYREDRVPREDGLSAAASEAISYELVQS